MRSFTRCAVAEPLALEVGRGRVVFVSVPGGGEAEGNEDAAGVWETADGAVVLALADGMGGCPGGGEAAALAVSTLETALARHPAGEPLRRPVVDAFEATNAALLEQGRGAGTTLVVVEIAEGLARAYHAGDSGALLVGQRGRLRMETIPHSPTGYAVAAGVIERDDVHAHAERHVLSNCVGATDMRIEIGPPVRLGARDTLLLASDGVLDNLRHEALVERIRRGDLAEAARGLLDDALRTQAGEGEIPGHPDDTTALLFRGLRAGRA